MKQKAVEILKKSLKKIEVDWKEENIEKIIEIPSNPEMGDYAFPCFLVAKEIKNNPQQIALNIRKEIGNPPEEFEEIQAVGPYVNFFINKKNLALMLISKYKEKKKKVESKNSEKIMVEFPSPNTNKPLHLGHLRNISIGESISRILEFKGNKVIRANLYNDRGIHICKSMAAYKKYGKNKIPKKNEKGDHFVGHYYVLFNKNEKKDVKLELESHRLLQKWEEGDSESRELWKKMNSWAYEGFQETFKKLNVNFDKIYYESKLYKEGKDIILDGVKKGVFQREKDNSVSVNLGKKLGKKILLRSDGTSVYITQDIYLAKKKFEEYKLNKSLYVVGNEQEHHFETLFKILEMLKIADISKLKHLSYGMVELPEGKMKSREGTVVDADDLIEKIQKMVKKDLEERYKLPKKEIEKRSLKITIAAIKYMLLKVDTKKNMIFNPKESISFEGDTGPYLLYSYARANSILKKAKKNYDFNNVGKINDKDKDLIAKMAFAEKIIDEAYDKLNPSIIAKYAYELSQIFNEFYHSSKIIGNENEDFKLGLVYTFKKILKICLDLLGIEALEEM